MAKHNEVGKLGESIATKFLTDKGHIIIERNYLKKCGEIDIITQKDNITHFVEVKTTSDINKSKDNSDTKTSYTSNKFDYWRPEEMVHTNKIQRLRRVISIYIESNNIEN